MKFASLNVLSVFGILIEALLVSLIIIIHGPESGRGDDIGTNFFLKASKSVPRIGRRSMDFDNHFLKASKSVPRIGRRDGPGQAQDMKGFPIISNPGPEMYLNELDQTLWSDWEKPYDSFARVQNLEKLKDFDGSGAYWTREKKDSELEEPRIQADVF